MKLLPPGIRRDLVVMSILAVLPVLVLAAGLVVFLIRHWSVTMTQEAQTEGLTNAVVELRRFWNLARSDVLFLSETPPIQDLLRARAHGGKDPTDSSTERVWRERLEQIFLSMADAKRIYEQIRYIDRDGMERVRVNLVGGRAVRVPADQLQAKRERYYFIETAKLKPGECYVSEIDLNREEGEVERPLKPMVRFATPVFDRAGEFQAIVIVNVLAEKMLQIPAFARPLHPSAARPPMGFWFIADSHGYYLHHSAAPQREWGSRTDLDTGEGLRKDFPEQFDRIMGGGATRVTWNGTDWLAFSKVARLWTEKERFLVVAHAMPRTVVMEHVYRMGVWLGVATLLALALATTAAWRSGRKVVGPLSQLSDSVLRFRKGQGGWQAVIAGDDEVGRLAASFNEMAEEISSQHERLEAEVVERTRDLEESRRAALSMMQDAETERQRAEEARAMTAKREGWARGLQAAGEELAAAATLEELAQTACRAAVEHLGLKLAWVGGRLTAGRVKPMAASGAGIEFVHESPGCQEEAARTGQQFIIPDTVGSPPFPGCREKAECQQFRSCATFPIVAGEERVGSFTIRCQDLGEDSVAVQAAPLIGTLARQIGHIWHRILLAEDLRHARTAADTANQAKSTFLANMSHEIRTPMNAILGFSQLMQRDPGLTVENRDHLEIINRSGEHLLTLINDILEMSKVEAGRITLNEGPFDLHAVLDDLGMMFRVRTDAKGLQLEVERDDAVPRYIVTDEAKLRQVLINLLGNAVKFTKEGGVALRVSGVRGQGAGDEAVPQTEARKPERGLELRFEVEDTGAGIPGQELGKLFDAFQQTESGRRAEGGTGLGLAISQAFARLMGGEITVQSQIGAGSVFRFSINVREGEVAGVEGQEEPRPVASLAPGQPEFRILAVDDDERNRRLLTEMLGSVGFRTRLAVNGQEALAAFEAWHPHLILMDGAMPVMDGYEATRRIKATERGKQTVVVVVTSRAFEEDRKEALEAGADDFLRKPFKEHDLFARIRAHLGVEYRYAEPTTPKRNLTDTRQMLALTRYPLAKLPRELVSQMRAATVSADLDLLNELINQAEQHDADIAQSLRDLAEDFDYEALANLFHTGDSQQ